MIQINLFVGSRYPINRKQLRATAARVLAAQRITHAQIDISIVGERKIKELNECKLKHEGITYYLHPVLHGRIYNVGYPVYEE